MDDTPAAHLASLGDMRIDTILGTLGIEVVEAVADRVVVRMPVSSRVVDGWGVLQGGALVTLAETAASIGALLAAGPGAASFGAEINASTLGEVREGIVEGVSVPIGGHDGLQVWETSIHAPDGTLVSRSRCTVALRPAAAG